MVVPGLRVVLVGRHVVMRGVARLSCEEAGAEVVAEVSDAGPAVDAVRTFDPDVVVVDFGDGSAEALDLLATVIAAAPGEPVLVVGGTDARTVLEAMRRGAAGYLVKPDGLRDVGQAVLRVASGERVLDPAVERTAVAELGRFARQAREGSRVEAGLSPREREVLSLLAEGLTTQQMARRLSISPRTVESHVAHLYRKLSVSSRVQALSRAVSLGLVETP